MNSVSSQFITNFILQKFSNKFQLSQNDIFLLSPILAGIMAKLFVLDFEPYFISVFVCTIITIIGYYIYKFSKIKKELDDEYIYGTFYDDTILKLFYSLNNDFQVNEDNGFYNVEKISKDVSTNYIEYTLPTIDTKVYFTDKKRNVKGYYMVNSIEKILESIETSNKTTKTCYRYLILALNKKGLKYTITNYIIALEEYMEKKMKEENRLILTFTKVQNGKNVIFTTMYDDKSTFEKRYNSNIKTYFSDKREFIWSMVSNVHFHPEKFWELGQAPRCNLLLYGPPGSGKSTLAYRLALTLGRSIISIDIASHYPQHGNTIEQIIRSPDKNKSSNYIYLIEEIDIAIKYLQKKKETEKKSVDEDDQSKCLEIEDLLEIFQGAVPIPGSIIIATTNHFEEIEKICPALVRPGRFTPIECTYMNWYNLQDLTQHYFGQKLTIPHAKIEIPTSEITEQALLYSFPEKNFEGFQNFLKGKLKLG